MVPGVPWRRPWKLGLRIVAWSKPRIFCEESVERLNLEFSETWRSTNSIDWKRWLLWSKWTLLSGRKKIWILISKTAMVGCCKLPYCRQMGLVMSMRFIFGDDWNDAPCKSLFLISGNDVIFLESWPLNFRVFIHTYSLPPQTYFWSWLLNISVNYVHI